MMELDQHAKKRVRKYWLVVGLSTVGVVLEFVFIPNAVGICLLGIAGGFGGLAREWGIVR